MLVLQRTRTVQENIFLLTEQEKWSSLSTVDSRHRSTILATIAQCSSTTTASRRAHGPHATAPCSITYAWIAPDNCAVKNSASVGSRGAQPGLSTLLPRSRHRVRASHGSSDSHPSRSAGQVLCTRHTAPAAKKLGRAECTPTPRARSPQRTLCHAAHAAHPGPARRAPSSAAHPSKVQWPRRGAHRQRCRIRRSFLYSRISR